MITTFKMAESMIFYCTRVKKIVIDTKNEFTSDKKIWVYNEEGTAYAASFRGSITDRISDIFDADNCGLTHYDFTQEVGYWKPQPLQKPSAEHNPVRR